MLRALLGIAFCAAVAGCASQDDAPPPSPPPPAARPAAPAPPVRPVAPDTFALGVDAEQSSRPVAPVRIDGACPFECCQYGTWTTSAPTRLFASAGDTTRVVTTVPAGTVLAVPTGHVLLTRLGRVVPREPVTLYRAFESPQTAAAGDTLLVLQTVGEGAYRVWYRGRLYEAEGAMLMASGPGALATSQWWAQATGPDGRTGWLWMDRTPPVRGADACGAPA